MMEQSDIDRLTEVYADRAYDTDPAYSDIDPVYLQRVQQVERLMLRSLRAAGVHSRISELRVADYGCGNGRWLARWLAWGALPANLVGLDVREGALALAQASLPGVSFRLLSGRAVPMESQQCDVVYQNLVFSSILSADDRRSVARDMTRLVKPGGLVLWYDFTVNNPHNPHVRGVPREAVKRLFPGFELLLDRKVTLAPPIARWLAPRHISVTDLLEAAAPFARTHLFMAFRRQGH